MGHWYFKHIDGGDGGRQGWCEWRGKWGWIGGRPKNEKEEEEDEEEKKEEKISPWQDEQTINEQKGQIELLS